LKDAVQKGKKSVAFVGTPCHIHAIRKIQAVPLKKYSNPIKFTIGLMCTESFEYNGLIEKHLQQKLGVKPSEVEKINIKGKILVYLKNGEVKEIPLAEAKVYTRRGCHYCDDFSNELADISLGGLGLNQWTFTIIRTERGEEIFRQAEENGLIKVKGVEESSFSMKLLLRLSERKRKINKN
jgi:coenzyme F420 hydrogenase subunit beta